MSDDDMHTRMSRMEWRQDALEDSHKRQEDRMTELSTRIDARFDQVMDAIGGLRDEKARNEGASEARMRMLKWLSLGLGAVGLLVTLGWINSADAAWLPLDMVVDPPIAVQYHTREVP